MSKAKLFTVLLAVVSAGTMYGTTAAKGLFSVSNGKTVQFANANSVYSENELIRWTNLENVTEAGWDVLTGAEWSYLLASGRTNANDLNALGRVNGRNGLIILPDAWVQPSGVPAYRTVDEAGISFENNVYTADQWAVMADAGAVFLPCAGYGWMDGSTYKVEDPTDHGAYWAKDEDTDHSGDAHCMRFNLDNIHDLNHAAKTNYYSVILVREVTILDETDEIADYTTKWTAAKEKDFAFVNRTLKKDGTFYTLCLPFDVPDIEDSPLAGAEVFTFDGGSVSGSEGNEELHLTLTPLAGTRLSAGVPYILRWSNTGETLATPLYFANVENWDDDTDADTDPGNETIKYHGVYPMARIPGYTTGAEPHYNFFMGANNTLYWPDDTLYPDSKMKGFRAYFYIIPGGGPNPAPVRRGMQAVWKISNGLNSPTGLESIQPSAFSIQKQLRDGCVVLMINGEQYTIGGQKL